MNIFGNYSKYYNLLYRDKDYAGEVEHVHSLIQKYNPRAKSVLDLGCGTGRHDFLLAEKGYSVTGVDMSEEMLAIANSQLSTFSYEPSTLTFALDDIRAIRLNKTFDAVISLFHVMSYQTTNKDLKATFKTVKAHLKTGGIFIFDCWYGPAVLTDRPAVRVKRMEDEEIVVTRIAEPVMHPKENVVDVNYHIFIKDMLQGSYEEVKETHRMRYLFEPELDMMLRLEGLEIIHSEEWKSAKEPGFDNWGVYFIACA